MNHLTKVVGIYLNVCNWVKLNFRIKLVVILIVLRTLIKHKIKNIWVMKLVDKKDQKH